MERIENQGSSSSPSVPTTPNVTGLASVKKIIEILKAHPLIGDSFSEGIQSERFPAVRVALKSIQEIDHKEEGVLAQVEKIGQVTPLIFREGAGFNVDVLDEERKVLFKVQILHPEDKEIFIIFNREITETEFSGGNKRMSESVRVTSEGFEKFLVSEEMAPLGHEKQELSLFRELNVRQHLEGIPYVVLPVKVVHIDQRSGEHPFVQQISYVSFKKGVPPHPVDHPEKAARQLLETFVAIHKKGVTHNDIKHANLIMTDEGEIFVIDWGTAIYEKDEKQTLEGAITPMYAPREVFVDQESFNKASEVQRIVNLYRRVERVIQMEGASDPSLEDQIVALKASLLEDFSTEVGEIKQKLRELSNDPEKAQLIKDLFSMEDIEEILISDYVILSVFASGRSVEGLVAIAENNEKEVKEGSFACFATCCIFGNKIALCLQEQKSKPVIDTSKLREHEARVKSDCYQIGLILTTLFACKKPIPPPFDEIIKGLLNENPASRMSMEQALMRCN